MELVEPVQRTEAPSGANPRFDPKLESLRGLASLSVVIAHCFWYYLPPGPHMFDTWQGWISFIPHMLMNENSAVVLFFVLSGYVLAIQWNEQPSYPAFIVRRIFRLTPTMWLACVVAFGSALVVGAVRWADYPVLLQAMAYQDARLSGPLWTIIAEMWCSLVFPVLYLVQQRAPTWMQVVCAIALVRLMYTGLFPPLAGNLIYFYLGALVHSIGVRLATKPFLVAALALYALPGFAPVYAFDISIWRFTSGLAAFVILSNVVHGRPARMLNWPAVRFVGRVSFPVYLLHYSILQLVIHMWAGAPWPLLSQIVLSAIVVPTSLLSAALCHRYVEAPLNRLGRHLGARLAPVRPSAVATT